MFSDSLLLKHRDSSYADRQDKSYCSKGCSKEAHSGESLCFRSKESVIPLFMQSGIGMSPFNASMVLFPAICLSCVIAPIAGQIYDKKGGKVEIP